MANCIQITKEGIEKLRGKISSEIIICLEAMLRSSNIRNKKKLRKKLKSSFKIRNKEVNFIISSFKDIIPPNSPRVHSRFVEDVVKSLPNKENFYSSFFGQLLYIKKQKSVNVMVLITIEHIFGIYFSTFWECPRFPPEFKKDVNFFSSKSYLLEPRFEITDIVVKRLENKISDDKLKFLQLLINKRFF